MLLRRESHNLAQMKMCLKSSEPVLIFTYHNLIETWYIMEFKRVDLRRVDLRSKVMKSRKPYMSPLLKFLTVVSECPFLPPPCTSSGQCY